MTFCDMLWNDTAGCSYVFGDDSGHYTSLMFKKCRIKFPSLSAKLSEDIGYRCPHLIFYRRRVGVRRVHRRPWSSSSPRACAARITLSPPAQRKRFRRAHRRRGFVIAPRLCRIPMYKMENAHNLQFYPCIKWKIYKDVCFSFYKSVYLP